MVLIGEKINTLLKSLELHANILKREELQKETIVRFDVGAVEYAHEHQSQFEQRVEQQRALCVCTTSATPLQVTTAQGNENIMNVLEGALVVEDA